MGGTAHEGSANKQCAVLTMLFRTEQITSTHRTYLPQKMITAFLRSEYVDNTATTISMFLCTHESVPYIYFGCRRRFMELNDRSQQVDADGMAIRAPISLKCMALVRLLVGILESEMF